MHCDERGNVIAHLQEMEYIYQQLASWNAKISDEDYVDAIIRSLPEPYSDLMSSVLTVRDHMGTPVTPAAVKDAIRGKWGALQMAIASRNREMNEIVQHTDRRGRQPGRGRRGSGGRVGNH